MAVTGTKGAVKVTTLNSDAYQRSFDRMIRDLWADTRKIAILALSTPMKVIDSYKHEWNEDNSRFRSSDSLGAALGAADSEMTVADGTKFLENDVWEANDGTNIEQVIVNGPPSGNLVPIAFIDGTGTAFANATKLIFISNASKEGGSIPSSTATSPDALYNYVNEFRVSFELTEWQQMMNMDWGKEETRLYDLKYNDFVEQLEKSAMFGRRSLRTVDGKNQTTSAGLLPQISTHNVSFNSGLGYGTTVSKAEMLALFEMTGDNDAQDMYLLTSNWFQGNIINSLALNDIQTNVNDKKYGINIKKLVTLNGDYDVVTTRLFHHYGSTNRYDLYGSYAVFLPKSNFSQFGFGKRAKIEFSAIQPDDNGTNERTIKGEHTTTRGWKLHNESEAWAIYGAQGVA